MKYKILILFLSISIITLTITSCSSIVDKTFNDNKKTSSNESESSEDNELIKKLEVVSNKHLEVLDTNSSMISVKDITFTLNENSSRIDEVGLKLEINSNYIRSIIFREQLLLTFDDYFADSIVEDFYENSNSGDKDDSSTGLGQIFARTAISAENTVNNNTKISSDNINDVKNMWYNLQDNDTNIYYVGLVLKEKAINNSINLQNTDESSVKNLFSKYNGDGENADLYGEQTYEYFLIFEDNNK